MQLTALFFSMEPSVRKSDSHLAELNTKNVENLLGVESYGP